MSFRKTMKLLTWPAIALSGAAVLTLASGIPAWASDQTEQYRTLERQMNHQWPYNPSESSPMHNHQSHHDAWRG